MVARPTQGVAVIQGFLPGSCRIHARADVMLATDVMPPADVIPSADVIPAAD
jgi:hypothetical protein